ncbi:DUF3304 domain-containing protein, partial [Pseudomonas aeruginosa]|uniref:DUF3304 domain-containing protein n=1 Tax=Pseudomonas aeruginosa TaxID=287 RepID=UPI00396A1434
FQGGGGGCSSSVPARWTPGMTVRVEWETGQGSSAGFPGFADEAKYLAWKKGVDAQERQNWKSVAVAGQQGLAGG